MYCLLCNLKILSALIFPPNQGDNLRAPTESIMIIIWVHIRQQEKKHGCKFPESGKIHVTFNAQHALHDGIVFQIFWANLISMLQLLWGQLESVTCIHRVPLAAGKWCNSADYLHLLVSAILKVLLLKFNWSSVVAYNGFLLYAEHFKLDEKLSTHLRRLSDIYLHSLASDFLLIPVDLNHHLVTLS